MSALLNASKVRQALPIFFLPSYLIYASVSLFWNTILLESTGNHWANFRSLFSTPNCFLDFLKGCQFSWIQTELKGALLPVRWGRTSAVAALSHASTTGPRPQADRGGTCSPQRGWSASEILASTLPIESGQHDKAPALRKGGGNPRRERERECLQPDESGAICQNTVPPCTSRLPTLAIEKLLFAWAFTYLFFIVMEMLHNSLPVLERTKFNAKGKR